MSEKHECSEDIKSYAISTEAFYIPEQRCKWFSRQQEIRLQYHTIDRKDIKLDIKSRHFDRTPTMFTSYLSISSVCVCALGFPGIWHHRTIQDRNNLWHIIGCFCCTYTEQLFCSLDFVLLGSFWSNIMLREKNQCCSLDFIRFSLDFMSQEKRKEYASVPVP